MKGQVRVYQRKIVARKRRRAFYYTFYSLCFAALLVSGVSYASHLESLAVRSVEVRGAQGFVATDIESIASGEMAGNYQGLFSKKNAFIYPKRGIEEAVGSMPRIKSAKVERKGMGTVVISVVERKPAALWCEDRQSNSLCYLVDETGFVFAPSFDSLEGASLFSYRGLIDEEPIGKRLLSEEQFKEIGFFMRELSALHVNPRSATLGQVGTMTVELSGGGAIVVDIKDDLSAILGNIAAVLSDKKAVPDLEEFLSRLEYIKFDAGNKVVYKMKGK